jgi:hypothetical protein
MNITFSLHASARRLRMASCGSLLPVSGSLLPFQKFAIQLVFLCIRGWWSALSFWSARSRDRGDTSRVGQMSRRGAALYVVSVQFLRRRLLRNWPALEWRLARAITRATRDRWLCHSCWHVAGAARDVECNDAAASSTECSSKARGNPVTVAQPSTIDNHSRLHRT